VSPRHVAVGAALALAFVLVLCVPSRGGDAERVAVEWLLAAVPAVLAAFGRPVPRG
jgi:hypothetical protein